MLQRSHIARISVFICLFIQFAFSQTQAINGSIRVRLTDPAGAAVPAATVIVTNVATGFTRSVPSNVDGYFVIPNLPIGTYNETFTKEPPGRNT
jgi:hypothetical protein